MTRIQFPFHRVPGGEAAPDVELVECTEAEWAQAADSGSQEWSVCRPEPGSADRLIRAVRLLGSETARGAAPVLRLVGA